VGVEKPHFGEGEGAVWNELETRIINLACFLIVFSFKFFVDSVVDPEINISAPEGLFGNERYVGDSALISFPDDVGFRISYAIKIS
jgi:hypothetical protein